MSEVLQESKTPEQRVFGDAFSFAKGAADEDTQSRFFRERVTTIKAGGSDWLPRVLDADSGISADMYKDGRIVATLDMDFETRRTDVYTTSDGSVFGDNTLCDQVAFDEAVIAAEQFAAGI